MSKSAKRWSIAAGVLALLVMLGVMFRGQLFGMVMTAAIRPGISFEETTPPAAPNYAHEVHWAALPDKVDKADFAPKGESDAQGNTEVAAFFIHPTTYYENDSWNQPLDHETANEFVDNSVMRVQASSFNSCCDIYAPRYRQATLYSFFDLGGDGYKALDLAYSDVERAFEYFLDNYAKNRPFILASHSQGSRHAHHLIRNVIHGTSLAERMVAAYLIGYGTSTADIVPICETASQTGCQISWNSIPPNGQFDTEGAMVCVNPLSWLSNDRYVSFAENTGALSFDELDTTEAGVTDAQCVGDQLVISEVRSENFINPFSENYHIYDYNFFYVNIRRNVKTRVAAYLDALAPR